MMPLAVAEDYGNPQSAILPLLSKMLLYTSLVNSAIIFGLSLSQLGIASFYTSPTAAGLTAIHSGFLLLMCYRESHRDPTYAPRPPRLATSRRLNIVLSYLLAALWISAVILLVIYITGSHKAPSIHRRLATAELSFVAVQSWTTLVFALQCTRERIGYHNRTEPNSRWYWFG